MSIRMKAIVIFNKWLQNSSNAYILHQLIKNAFKQIQNKKMKNKICSLMVSGKEDPLEHSYVKLINIHDYECQQQNLPWTIFSGIR